MLKIYNMSSQSADINFLDKKLKQFFKTNDETYIHRDARIPRVHGHWPVRSCHN